jgi:hypothetical protein
MARASSDSPLLLHVFRVEKELGNACLLELPDGSCGFVDWGTQRQEALDAALLLTEGGHVSFIAATHGHADHTLGLEMLITNLHERGVRIERLVYPASTLHRENAYLTRARDAALDLNITMNALAVDNFPGPSGPNQPPYLAFGEDWEVRVLSPSAGIVGSSETRSLRNRVVPGNDTSLVVLFRFKRVSRRTPGVGRALLPGDSTPATLKFAKETGIDFPELALDNQAFLVPHHGSSNNLPTWIDRFLHGIVVISSGTKSTVHPSAKVLKRLSRHCRHGRSTRLFCNAYAGVCSKAFGKNAESREKKWIEPGSCFGDIVIRIDRKSVARVVRSSAKGQKRRKFGYCGNVDKRIRSSMRSRKR